MLAVSLKWRLGVVRRRPKGTELGASDRSQWNGGQILCLPRGWEEPGLGGGQG